jgi:membrane-bound lytic murein transglycosylase D
MKRHLFFFGCFLLLALEAGCPPTASLRNRRMEPAPSPPPVEVSSQLPAEQAAPAPEQTSTPPEAEGVEAVAEKAAPEEGLLPQEAPAGESQSSLDEALEYCRAAEQLWKEGEIDQAIEALDKSYELVLKTSSGGDTELEQQKQDIRLMIARRLIEIQASQAMAVSGNGKSIPLPLNETVQAEIRSFTGPEKNFFLESYRRAGAFIDRIRRQLKENDLPEELAWLPLIESGYKTRALSKARALGLWQFIPSTGYRFGLKRDAWVDDRMDPELSTRAAIAYLKELHSLFGDWLTALAAYNCGEGLVMRLIRDQNIKYLDDFWDLYARLPPETRRYVPRFLAVLHLIGRPQEFGLELPPRESEPRYEEIELDRQLELAALARVLGISEEQLTELNPSLRREATPPGTFRLRLPPGGAEKLAPRLADIPTYKPPEPQFAFYRVKSGDTLSQIAARFRVRMEKIAQANRLSLRSTLRIGQVLRIPLRPGWRPPKEDEKPAFAPAPSPSATRTRPAPAGPGAPVEVEVQAGDSLYQLARRYRTDVDSIIRLNQLSGMQLKVGQKLKIRPGATEPVAASATYTVQSGDTPFSIARKFNMALERLLEINNLPPASVIHPGQVLLVEAH